MNQENETVVPVEQSKKKGNALIIANVLLALVVIVLSVLLYKQGDFRSNKEENTVTENTSVTSTNITEFDSSEKDPFDLEEHVDVILEYASIGTNLVKNDAFLFEYIFDNYSSEVMFVDSADEAFDGERVSVQSIYSIYNKMGETFSIDNESYTSKYCELREFCDLPTDLHQTLTSYTNYLSIYDAYVFRAIPKGNGGKVWVTNMENVSEDKKVYYVEFENESDASFSKIEEIFSYREDGTQYISSIVLSK